MLSDVEENLNTLMLLTGISEEEAAMLLRHRVRVISSTKDDLPLLAADIRNLLKRTLTVVGERDKCDLELAIGTNPTTDNALILSLSNEEMKIMSSEDKEAVSERTRIPGITRKGCACFAAGFVLSRLLGDSLPYTTRSRFDFRFENLGFPTTGTLEPLDIKDSVLAGGGGVANGFLWALEELNPVGKLTIVDPKKVRSGNANRCLYFQTDDCDYKATILAERVNLPYVEVIPYIGTLHDYVASRPDRRLPWLISTADSRVVRRSFQNELPLAVFDASTTDVSEVIIHSHEQPNGAACLSCIYPHIEDEDHRDKHIAETLGLTLEEVQARFIDQKTAEKLATNFAGLKAEALVGIAFDSLHKALCGQQALLTQEAKQEAAPFAFVSNLAGVLLALEMYRHQANYEDWSRTNYMAVSPWVAPHKRLRRLRPRLPDCEFCSNPSTDVALREIWSGMGTPSARCNK